jgi:hypothetical protein
MHPCIGYARRTDHEIFLASGLHSLGAQALDHNEFLMFWCFRRRCQASDIQRR